MARRGLAKDHAASCFSASAMYSPDIFAPQREDGSGGWRDPWDAPRAFRFFYVTATLRLDPIMPM